MGRKRVPILEQLEKRFIRQAEKYLIIQWRNKQPLALTANRVIPQSKLQKIWVNLSSDQMPKIRVYLLSNRQFDKLCIFDCRPDFSILEYGRAYDAKHTAGVLIRMKDGHIIFIRKGIDIEGALLHEVKHVANKDIDRFSEALKIWESF